jgi:hypothetical protein
MNKSTDDQYCPAETRRRMENALRRAPYTPPKPHKDMIGNGKRVSKG